MTPPSALPNIRLKPKSDARRIRHGAPWAWADELVLDRRTRGLRPGSLAILEDADRRPLGLGIATVATKIAFRMLDRDADAVIDAGWFAARIGAALTLRNQCFDTPFYRLIHAEGDALPGLIVDRFGDTLVVQPNAIWLEERLDLLTACLRDLTGCNTIIKNGSGRARAAEGLADEMTVLTGTAPGGPIAVQMNGATYLADVMGGQKTGLFYDQRPNHAFAASLARDGQVLDVFSHAGGFALATLAAGAAGALAVDASAPALDLAEGGAKAMGIGTCLTTRRGDAFAVMEDLAGEGAGFDLVIADPPAFAPSKPALDKGLRAYERVARLAAPLVTPGGVLILCSCSHAADLTRFRAACLRGIGRAGRVPRLIHTGFAGPDHPQHPDLTETGYLKVLAFRLLP
ncbi:class I SAM-dependent rRNA methyltransferase [Rhodophyticola sp. CCM32]|uniref:RSP_2647 family RNA methyltransferase n=1 Tax=Rhodophyticola sp. CCM32 TaxID=2916397 RepID=UPI00107F158E|nr:class I SAM-dependent rRNA methyltransferase [Rhodophyticola sp. CCM32]QBX99717.1 class I SAM-dependent rRNA methyltransferase [Rhodophyticola sp. CCM32]